MKGIRALERNASKGDIYAMLELSSCYEEGRFVEENIEKSAYYMNQAVKKIAAEKIKINSIHIENFRALNNLTIDNFDKNLNVFIGDNGAGKTSILDAIEKAIGWLRVSIIKPSSKLSKASSILLEDINIYNDLPYANITLELSIGKVSSKINLTQAKTGYSSSKNELAQFNNLGRIYNHACITGIDIQLPLVAYYNVSRCADVKNADWSSDAISENRFDAYNKSLDGKTDFSIFCKWFKELDDINIRGTARKNNKTRSFSEEQKIKLLKSISSIDEFDNVDVSIQGILEKVISEINVSDTDAISGDNSKAASRIIQLLQYTISKFMVGYSNLRVVNEPKLDLYINKNGRDISVFQLSQGEKTLLALVLDIAKRLIQLNPDLENPLEAHGIILIDELDLHLHPKWQRTVTTSLIKTFPNCQFFISTHSPIVIGEVLPTQLFILTESFGEITLNKVKQSYGLSSNDVLDEIMSGEGFDSVSLERNLDVASELSEIFKLIEISGIENLEKASIKIEQLENKLNGEIPELITAKTELEFQLLNLE